MKKAAITIFILLVLPFLQAYSHDLKIKNQENWQSQNILKNIDKEDESTKNITAAFVLINGKVTDHGVGLSGVTVYLSGSSSGNFITDASGDYSFAVTSGFSYTITPSKMGYSFTPSTAQFLSLTHDSTQNFSTVIQMDSIKGIITKGGLALASVQVNVTGSATGSDTTGADGLYAISVPTGGNYTVTPSKLNHIFTPANKVFINISGTQIQNFTAQDSTYTISGKVYFLGSGLSGVTVNYTGTSIGSVTTDSTGSYWFPVSYGSFYTITPMRTDYTFNPASQTYISIDSSKIQDFVASIQIPDAPYLFSPSMNSSSSVTSVSFIWQTTPRASSYNLQVSTNSLFSNPFVNRSNLTSTSFNITNLTPGVTYYWRVSANNGTGTSGWSSTWNFTVLQTITAPPSPLTPDNNSVNLTLSPTLTWSPVGGASYYTLQVSTSSDFSTYVFNQTGITSTNITIPGLQNNMKYYWRVSASNVTITSDWSAVWNFTTVPTVPGIPMLSSPANNLLNVQLSVTVSWISVSGAASYKLQVSPNSDFSTLIVDQSGLTNTSFNLNGLSYNLKYYWRVSAVNLAGTGAWSDVWKFSTLAQIPVPPVLSSPANFSANISYNPIISWNPVDGAATYDLQVSKTSDFSYNPVNEPGLTVTSYQLLNLDAGTYYYWRVRSRNSAGFSDWASAVFMTKQPVSGPTLISPENNSRLTSLDAIFSWARIENVPYYELIVSKFSDFRNSVSNSRSLTNTYYVIVGLDYSTIYYWKVRAVNGTENGDWSQVFNFTTMSSIKGPSLINPGKSSYGIGTSALFSWQPLNDVMGYDLQLSTDQNFTSILSNFVGISGTSQTVNYLPSSSTLWWRVRGWKNADIGEWSEGWSFKTASSSLSTPLVIYPQDQRTNVSVNGILRWGAVSGATSYEVILSDKPDLSNVLGFYIGLATPSLSLSDLAFSQTYYWRVLARKDNETSPWTPVFSFTTHSSSVGVKEVDDIAKSYSLSQNYPNPFNPSTNITYSIMEPSLVTIKIYDIYGREVETLVNQFHSSGKYVTTWEPKNIPTGVYYYQIHAGKYNEVRKMVYIR